MPNPPRKSLFDMSAPGPPWLPAASPATLPAAPPSLVGRHRRLFAAEAPKVSSQVLTETKEEFLEGFAKLFNSEKYSDVTLFLGPEKVRFHAHYAILGVRTSYFDKAKEHGFKEGETNEYHFPDYSVHALWRVLQYFYTGDYSAEPNRIGDGGDPAPISSNLIGADQLLIGQKPGLAQKRKASNIAIDDDLELVRHPKVYAIADLLDLKVLKKLCLAKFEEQLDQHWVGDTFTDAVREVYGTTYSSDRTMKDPLIKIARQNGKALFARPEFVKLTKEVAEFSTDVLASIFSK